MMGEVAEYRRCPKCNKEIRADAALCGYCWTKLSPSVVSGIASGVASKLPPIPTPNLDDASSNSATEGTKGSASVEAPYTPGVDVHKSEEEKSADLADTERKQLELDKLRLEIRELSSPWWRRLPNLGPIASITVAIIGLVWAISNGFFDVARRELDIKNRELEIKRERLIRETHDLERQKGQQQATLAQLREEVARERAALEKLDRPVIKERQLVLAPWLEGRNQGDTIQILYWVAHAGVARGTVDLSVDIECGVLIEEVGVKLKVQIVDWGETAEEGIWTVRVNTEPGEAERMRNSVRAVAAQKTLPPELPEVIKPLGGTCHLSLQSLIQRPDGKKSFFDHMSSTEGYTWATNP